MMRKFILGLAALLFSAPLAAQTAQNYINDNGSKSPGQVCVWSSDGVNTKLCNATTPLPVTGSFTSSTASQADPGSDATKASAVQGVTGGKPVSVKIDQTTDGTTNKVAATQATASSLNAQVVGAQARAASITANPTLIGCRGATSAPSAVTNGQLVDPYCTSTGQLVVAPTISAAHSDASSNTMNFAINSVGNAALTGVVTSNFNGSTWDRTFTCTNSVAVNVTGGNTTEVVALSGSTITRVCSVNLGISATGTVGISYGTGTNCGTGTTVIVQPIPLVTGNVWSSAAGAGSLFRTASGNALCVVAGTGNVTGVITYARY